MEICSEPPSKLEGAPQISDLAVWLDRAVAHDFRRVGRVRGGALGSRIVLVSWDLNKSEFKSYMRTRACVQV